MRAIEKVSELLGGRKVLGRSRALAAMELFVNLDPGLAPPELVFIAVDIPDDMITVVKLADLPSNWNDYPAPDDVKDIGTEWVVKKMQPTPKTRPSMRDQSGVPGRTRTCDPLLRRQTLYPTELRALIALTATSAHISRVPWLRRPPPASLTQPNITA